MRRSALSSLRHVLRISRCGDGLVPQHVAEHLDAIASLLNVDPARLAGLDLERPEVRGRLTAALERAENQQAANRLVEADRRRDERRRSLVAAARWSGDRLVLPPAELFALTAAAMAATLRFEAPGFAVHVDRALVARAGRAISRLPEPVADVDADALHLRWRGGRGGLDLRSPPPAPRDPPAFIVRFESPRVARPPVILAEVLRDLGLTA